MVFLASVTFCIAVLCFKCLQEHISGTHKLSKKGIAIAIVLGVSMTVIFLGSFTSHFAGNSGGNGKSSKFGVIENDDGSLKYYDKSKWTESKDGKYIYDKYGNVKKK